MPNQAPGLLSPMTELRLGALGIRNLQIKLPDGRPLLTDLDIKLTGGASLLVKGPSACWSGAPSASAFTLLSTKSKISVTNP
jgi:hypothetical protein